MRHVMLFPPRFWPLRHSTASKQATQVGGKIEQNMLAVVFGEEGRGSGVAVKEEWRGRLGMDVVLEILRFSGWMRCYFICHPLFLRTFCYSVVWGPPGATVCGELMEPKFTALKKRQVNRKADKRTDILFADFVFSFCSSHFCDALNTISFQQMLFSQISTIKLLLHWLLSF